jgi:hypothetical protein
VKHKWGVGDLWMEGSRGELRLSPTVHCDRLVPSGLLNQLYITNIHDLTCAVYVLCVCVGLQTSLGL